MLTLTFCNEEPQEILVSNVVLSETSINIPIGNTLSLSAKVFPDNATNQTIFWSSSNESVAKVEGGLISALNVGEASIKASCGDKWATCMVNVTPIYVEDLTLNPRNASLKVGETISLSATIKPENATDKTIIWSSSCEEIATIKDGVVSAIKIGSATVFAKAGEKTASCTIDVVATEVTSIDLDKSSASLKIGEKISLTATVKPDDATDKTVIWSTSDASVATVSNGVVTAVKVGTTTITAKAGDKSATCAVTVVATPVTSVTLDKANASLKAGETVTLLATVEPYDATDKTVTWSTSDVSVATVSNGVITAIKMGAAIITAKAGDKTATCTITVLSGISNNNTEHTKEEELF